MSGCSQASIVWFIFRVCHFLLQSDDVRCLKVFRKHKLRTCLCFEDLTLCILSKIYSRLPDRNLLLPSSGLNLKTEATGLIVSTSMRPDVQELVNVVEPGLLCLFGTQGPQCSEFIGKVSWRKSCLVSVLPSIHILRQYCRYMRIYFESPNPASMCHYLVATTWTFPGTKGTRVLKYLCMAYLNDSLCIFDYIAWMIGGLVKY